MTKNTSRGLIILAIVLAVFSLIAFAAPFVHTAVFWIGYGFGVLAILFQLYIFKASFAGNGDAKSRFYGFPIARLGVYYLVTQLILSIIEMALAKLIPAWPAAIVNALALAFILIGCITAETMRDEIVQQDGKLKKNVSTMRELQSMAASMVGQCSDEEMKSIVKKSPTNCGSAILFPPMLPLNWRTNCGVNWSIFSKRLQREMNVLQGFFAINC